MKKRVTIFLFALLTVVGVGRLKAQDPFIGEIRIFAGNYAPMGWMICAGQVLQINQYQALYSVIGAAYGGNGVTTFALPNLLGRAPLGVGTGAGLTPRVLGEKSGQEGVVLTTSQVASHVHPMNASSAVGTTNTPSSTVTLAAPPNVGTSGVKIYATPSAPAVPISSTTVGVNTIVADSHNNMMPYAVVNFIIAIEGLYPPRP